MERRSLIRILCSPPPWIMGVLNVTPDSFSDGGTFLSPDAAIVRARELIKEGAHIIDIGGEATGPGSVEISAGEELSRIRAIVERLADTCFLSIDTYHAETARVCLKAGARMINDISGLRSDPKMAEVVRAHDAFVVLMHSKEAAENPRASADTREYSDIIQAIRDFLEERISFATKSGINADRILLDPGMGRFLSHDNEYSWELLRRFAELQRFFPDYPLVVATSRKGFLGGSLPERDPTSQLTALAAVRGGASIIRTHRPAMARDFITIGRKIGLVPLV